MELPNTPINDRLQRLARCFAANGHRLYLVGGPVRDALLGRPIHDVDLTTDATPTQIKQLAEQTRPTAVFDVGARFGTISVRYEAGDGASWLVEITTFRTEQYLDGARKPAVQFGNSLIEDLARRDFTINAIAVDLIDGSVHDPCSGRDDLTKRVLRAVGDPDARFADDPLRLLRAVRFVAELGFTLDAETATAISRGASGLERISRERIASELQRILVSNGASAGIRLATDLGLMAHVIPEVVSMRGTSQRPLHHKDVFEHTLGVIDNIPEEIGLRWAALMHDIGKPATRSVVGGAVHFFGHEDVGARLAKRIMRGLNLDTALVGRVVDLVRNHLRINSYDASWTDAAVRRVIREVGPNLRDLIELSRADVTSYRVERVLAAQFRADEFARRCDELLAAQDIAMLQSPLDGDELMRLFDRTPGAWIRPIKDYLLGLVIEGTLAEDDKERATQLALAFIDRSGTT